jgi:hypothetical protein
MAGNQFCKKTFSKGKFSIMSIVALNKLRLKKKLCVTKWEKMLLYLGTANNNLSITQILKLLEE